MYKIVLYIILLILVTYGSKIIMLNMTFGE